MKTYLAAYFMPSGVVETEKFFGENIPSLTDDIILIGNRWYDGYTKIKVGIYGAKDKTFKTIKMQTKTVNFKGKELKPVFSQYFSNGRTAIQLNNKRGEPYLMATVNIPEVELNEKETVIKDYSENAGIFDALVLAGIIKDTGKSVDTGFVKCRIAEII